MTEKALFLKSASEMTDAELDSLIDRAKRGEQHFEFANKNRFKPKKYGVAPMIISDEIVGGRYSPADGKVYENKKDWHRSFALTGIEMMDANTPLPKRKIDKISDQEYIDTVSEAERMLDWGEAKIDEREVAENKQIREAMLNKHGTKEQRKSKNKRKIIDGQ